MESIFKKSLNHWNFKNILKEYNIHKFIIYVFFLITIIYIGKTNYILSHSIIETLNSAICFSLVIIIINCYQISYNNYFIYLGIVFAFVSFFNFLHDITYMGIFMISKNSINLSLQLNIVYRLIEGFSILISFVFLYKTFKPYIVFYIYMILSLLLLYIIFYTNSFPDCFVFGVGLTRFEIKCEYIILLTMSLSIILFFKKRKYFAKPVVFYMSLYLILTILIRVIGIINASVFNDFNLISHILKFVSYYFLYKALVEKVLKKPLDILLDDLSNKNLQLEVKALQLQKTISRLNEENIKLQLIREELDISEMNYKKFLEFLPVAVLVTQNSKFIYANTAAIKLFEAQNEQEFVSKLPLNLPHDNYLKDLSQILKNQQNNINTCFNPVEYKLVTFQKRTIDVELKSIPLESKENLYVTVVYDISARKKSEETARLLNESKENDRLKTEFFANLSHELRTPINVIYSALQVVDLNPEEKNIKKYNLVIKQNCYRLLRLINNIIDSTKIDAGFLTLNLTYKNIVPVVEDIVLSISPYVESKGMNLIFDTDIEEKSLDFDPDIIERIILNLLSNAVKFGHKNGNINVNIFDKDSSIVISVKDDGIGIPESHQSFIFDRFKQVDKSFTRNNEGSGIGLSLVKSLIELHSGTIKLNSKEGIGSEFIIELPVLETLKHCCEAKKISQDNIVQKINIEFSDIYS